MQKAVIIVIVLILILIASFFLFKQYVGDIRPALLPSQGGDLAQQVINEADGVIPFDTKTVPFDLKTDDRFSVNVFADGIGKVRDLAFSPEGILLASVPGEGRVIALAVGSDGSVSKKVVVDELSGPHGIAFNNGKLFIAEDNRLGRYSWNASEHTAVFEKELMKLPSGSHDAHTILFGKDNALYVKVGSSCNVCIETDPLRAAIIKTDAEGNDPQVFATGVRNAAFMALHPESGEIWATENGRDNLGDDLPPEEINIIKEGRNYGWPLCYGNYVHDTTFDKNMVTRNPCLDTELPVAFMQAHSAPLGLAFIPKNFSDEFDGDLVVAFHGSWNRSEPTGYKVVKLNIENSEVKEQEDFLSGFIEGSNAIGRPVDLEFDRAGNLFVSDDKYGAVYVISKK